MTASAHPVSARHDADPFEDAKRAAADIARLSGVDRFDLALTLGSGWGHAANLLGTKLAVIPADQVHGFHKPALAGHPGTLTAVELPDGRHALVIGARTHFYQGLGAAAVAHGVRTAAQLGARIMVLTNGAGGIRPEWKPGTPVLISDHINLTGATPLEGAAFVDLTNAYSQRLRDIAHRVAPGLDEGVYVQFRGPQYETPAEVRMARTLGGDIVGMSTALETIAARQLGMEVLAISLITNAAAGITAAPLDHAEVIAAGQAAEQRVSQLLADIVAALPTRPGSSDAAAAR